MNPAEIYLHEKRRRVILLRDRGACIVPKGVWHGQVVHAKSELMFITPGRGTQHRPTLRRP
jgi:hypothetical protein